MSEIITICGNTETILDGFDAGELPHEIREEIAIDWSDNVAKAIRGGRGIDYEVCHEFRAYHGGRYDSQAAMHSNTGGRVSCRIGASQEVKDLCHQARQVADEAAESYVAEELSAWA